jgi:hypothetical protein
MGKSSTRVACQDPNTQAVQVEVLTLHIWRPHASALEKRPHFDDYTHRIAKDRVIFNLEERCRLYKSYHLWLAPLLELQLR